MGQFDATVEAPSTPDGAALSLIALRARSGDSMDAALQSLALAPLAVGEVRLVDLLGVDRGLAVRWSPTLVQLTPHGGALITRRLMEKLARRGVLVSRASPDPRQTYPEAADLIEACVLDALASASSPRAVDVLLRQRDIWRTASGGEPDQPLVDEPTQKSLDRLCAPPTVVLLGAPNIGKSTLTNALAGRQVSLVADQPGVTRDHVGVTIEVDGLAIRLIDAAGLSAEPQSDALDRETRRLTLEVVRRADLLILCADPGSSFPDPSALALDAAPSCLRLGLRADLGVTLQAELNVSALKGGRIAALAQAMRRRLLPDAALSTSHRWRFHSALPGGPAPS